MTGGEKVLIVAIAGLGIVAFLKFQQTAAANVSPPVSRVNTGPANPWDAPAASLAGATHIPGASTIVKVGTYIGPKIAVALSKPAEYISNLF